MVCGASLFVAGRFLPGTATTAATAVESGGVSSTVVSDTNDQAVPASPELSVAVGIRTNRAETAEEECRHWIKATKEATKQGRGVRESEDCC